MRLTQAQTDILYAIAKGIHRRRELAAHLGLSLNAVDYHTLQLRDKLGFPDKNKMALFLFEYGELLEPQEKTAYELDGREVPSPREQEVVQLIDQCQSPAEIAKTLNISRATVETHRENIQYKLGLESLHELNYWIFRQSAQGRVLYRDDAAIVRLLRASANAGSTDGRRATPERGSGSGTAI